MSRTLAFVATATALISIPASAQPPASQHGAVSQRVNQTLISLEYDRPVARGRALFGEIVEFDAIWTPGANRATWIEFSGPVTVEGEALGAGPEVTPGT